MKTKFLLLSCCAVLNLSALTIDEAVESALESSNLLSSKAANVKSAEANVAVAQSGYMPQISLDYKYTKRDFENFIKRKQESLFNASVDLNLFNGFYDKYSVKSQKALQKGEELLYASAKADLIQQTKDAYISLLQAQKLDTVQDDAVSLLENQLKDAKNMMDSGLIPKSQYLKVKVEWQSAKQQKLKAASDLVNAKNRLSRLTELDISPNMLEEANITKEISSFEDLQTLSLKHRSELAYLEAMQESSTAGIKALNSSYYPSVNLALDYNKYGDEFIPDKFSYGDFGYIDDEAQATLQLHYDLYDGGSTRAQKQVQKAKLLSLKEEYLQTQKEITLQLKDTLETLKVTEGQIEVAALSVDEAKEHYRMTQNRFKQQLDSTTDLLDARLLLTQATYNHYQAIYEHQKAIVTLERVLEHE